jgi:glutathione S-transferase
VDRYKLQNALSYISGELHGSVGPLFNPTLSQELRSWYFDRVQMKLKYINDSMLAGKDYVLGSKPSVADFYLYIVLSWHGYLGWEISHHTNVAAFFDRVKSLEVVQKAHASAAAGPSST